MATYVDLTIPVKDIIGADYDPRRTSAYITANTPNSVIVVDGTSIRVGGHGEKFDTGGTLVLTDLVATNSADNPTSFGYRVTIVYTPKGKGKQESITTSDFPLTADANLAAIEEAWDDIALPPSWRSDFRDEMEALRDESESNLATQVDISSISTSDGVVQALVKNTGGSGPLTKAALDAGYAAIAGVPINMRTPTNAPAGIIDWGYGAGVTGYLFHLRAQPDSTTNEYALGIGLDNGDGGGVFVNMKTPNGRAFYAVQNPVSGIALAITNNGSSPTAYIRVGKQGGSFRVESMAREGFADGVLTSGSTTFTSATGTFTAGDVGQVLSIAGIPGGNTPAPFAGSASTTIATYVSATEVTLAVAPTASYTSVRFTVDGRTPATSQVLIEGRDTNSTTPLFKLGRGEHQLLGVTGQTAVIFRVNRGGDANNAFEVAASGFVKTLYGVETSNAGSTSTSPLFIRNFSTSAGGLQIRGAGGTVANHIELRDSSGVLQSRADGSGRWGTLASTAPADGSVSTGEAFWWFDKTAGAAKIMFKAKDAGGTVRTGSVALA